MPQEIDFPSSGKVLGTTQLENITEDVQGCIAKANNVLGYARANADRIVGPTPSAVGTDADVARENGSVEWLRGLVTTLSQKLDALDDQVARLNNV